MPHALHITRPVARSLRHSGVLAVAQFAQTTPGRAALAGREQLALRPKLDLRLAGAGCTRRRAEVGVPLVGACLRQQTWCQSQQPSVAEGLGFHPDAHSELELASALLLATSVHPDHRELCGVMQLPELPDRRLHGT